MDWKPNLNKRATLIAGTDSLGGDLVDSELRPQDFIDLLYAEFAISEAVTMITDVKGNLVLPKQDGRVVASWGTEVSTAPESNPTFTVINFSPKELRVLTKFSRTFLIQSSIDAENLARLNIMRSLGEVLDQYLIYGTGQGQQIKGVNALGGIQNSPNNQRIRYSKADGLSYADCLEGLEKIGDANADGPSLKWITSWGFWKQAKITPELPNGSRPIWQDNRIADVMATQTSHVYKNDITKDPDDTDSDQAFVGTWAYQLVPIWGMDGHRR